MAVPDIRKRAKPCQTGSAARNLRYVFSTLLSKLSMRTSSAGHAKFAPPAYSGVGCAAFARSNTSACSFMSPGLPSSLNDPPPALISITPVRPKRFT